MIIVLDAGHGPETPGKRSPAGMREFSFNEAVSRGVGEQLSKKKGVTVCYSHASDKDVPLAERTRLANRVGADCFISIHANAFGAGWNLAEGIETYIHQSRPVDALNLAKRIQQRLIQTTKRKDRGVKTADFYVLRATKMTALLIECGFMTNKQEAALLASAPYRQQCANAIASAVISHYRL